MRHCFCGPCNCFAQKLGWRRREARARRRRIASLRLPPWSLIACIRSCTDHYVVSSDKATATPPPKFVTLLRYYMKKGSIPDSILELAGVTQDTNLAGEIVRRDAPITNESWQRAKTSTHECVAEECEAVLEAWKAEICSKQSAEQVARARLLDRNKDCETLVHALYHTHTSTPLEKLEARIVGWSYWEQLGGAWDWTRPTLLSRVSSITATNSRCLNVDWKSAIRSIWALETNGNRRFQQHCTSSWSWLCIDAGFARVSKANRLAFALLVSRFNDHLRNRVPELLKKDIRWRFARDNLSRGLRISSFTACCHTTRSPRVRNMSTTLRTVYSTGRMKLSVTSAPQNVLLLKRNTNANM